MGEFQGHGGGRNVREIARRNELPMRHVGIDVEGDAVHGDPAGDMDADGGDLSARRVDAMLLRVAPRFDREGVKRPHGDLFQSLHVASEVRPPVVEVENGVGDELTGAVVGDVASPFRLDDLDPRAAQSRRRENSAAIAPPPERDDGIVLGEEKRVRGVPGDHLGAHGELCAVGVVVGAAAEVDEAKRAAHGNTVSPSRVPGWESALQVRMSGVALGANERRGTGR